MNKDEFISLYFRNDNEKFRKEFMKLHDAKECNCNKKYCKGWAMFQNAEILERTRL